MSESTGPIFEETNKDELSTVLKVVSFCVPIAGAIIYFTSKNENPMKAKSACNFALYGIVFGIVLNVAFMLLGGAAM